MPRARSWVRPHDRKRCNRRFGADLEVTQEPFGAFPFPTHPKIEHHWATRPAVLPEVSLVIFASTIVHLHSHGRFVGLDIGTDGMTLTFRLVICFRPGATAAPLGRRRAGLSA